MKARGLRRTIAGMVICGGLPSLRNAATEQSAMHDVGVRKKAMLAGLAGPTRVGPL